MYYTKFCEVTGITILNLVNALPLFVVSHTKTRRWPFAKRPLWQLYFEDALKRNFNSFHTSLDEWQSTA